LDLSVGGVIFMTSVIIARVSNGVDSAAISSKPSETYTPY
jgi:hypothetical protein